MIGYGIVLGLLASVFKSSKSITTKLASESSNEYVTSLSTRLFSLPVFAVGVVLTDTVVLSTSPVFLSAVFINAGFMIATTVLIAKALTVSDISVISPLLALVPVTVVLPSYLLLGEVPTVTAGIGIMLVSVGAYTLNLSAIDGDYLEPFRLLRSDTGAQYILVVLVIVSVSPSIDKIGIAETSPLMWVLSTHILATTGILVVCLLLGAEISDPLRHNSRLLVLVGLASSLIWVCQSYGYTITQVSYIQALKRVSLLFSVAAGGFVFDEQQTRERFVSSLVMLGGVVTIVLGV